jgi:hypothetical protein
MRLTRRDGLATLFVSVAAVLYGLWLTGTAMADMSTRVLGTIVFGLGWAACTSNQTEMAFVYGVGGRRRAPMAYVVIASIVGAVALVAGIITLLGANEAMLVTLVAATITLWAMSTVRHAIARETRVTEAHSPKPLTRPHGVRTSSATP